MRDLRYVEAFDFVARRLGFESQEGKVDLGGVGCWLRCIGLVA
jgi:hypothetical protein